MKTWLDLENQLRSWTPRAPSAKLKERIFGGEDEEARPMTLSFGGNWRWLAPAMGVCLLVLTVLSPRDNPPLYFAHNTNDWVETLARNTTRAAYLAESFHTRQNTLDREILEWRYEKQTVSPTSSLPVINTNTLLR